MNLDDLDLFAKVDTDNMLHYINDLPNQFEDAWAFGQSLTLNQPDTIRQLSVCGMGGSAISGDLLAAVASDSSPIPVMVIRGYELPAYIQGKEHLVVTLSHSGNTEETLSMARQAIERGTSLLAITTGGALAGVVSEAGGDVWKYDYVAQPRATMGWLYGLLLAAAEQAGVLNNTAEAVEEAVSVMRKYQEIWGAEMMAARNPAKRYAGQLVDCIPVIWGSGILAPVARRWKTQINENSKSSASYEELPELNHNSVVGIVSPEELMVRHKFQIIQLRSRYDHPRVSLRHDLTHKLFLGEAIITDPVKARGESQLAQQMSMVLFGDYVSYYLAMAYQVNPTPVEPIMMLKSMMAEASSDA